MWIGESRAYSPWDGPRKRERECVLRWGGDGGRIQGSGPTIVEGRGDKAKEEGNRWSNGVVNSMKEDSG